MRASDIPPKSALDSALSHHRRHTLIIAATCLAASVFWLPMVSGEALRGWDALTHVFFAQGYADNWWSTTDYRWYGGYPRASYPPLAHQLVALLILVTQHPEDSYQLVDWLLLAAGPLAAFRFARIFVD